MYYQGYFRSIDTKNDPKGQLYKVVILTNFRQREIAFGGDLTLSDTPFTVTYESEDDNLFKPYKCSVATVGIIQQQFNFDFINTKGNNVMVMLLKLKDGADEEKTLSHYPTQTYDRRLRTDKICYDLEWIGYATPNVYSQSYEDVWDGYEMECQDALSTLQYFDYNKIGYTTQISMIDILINYCKFLRSYNNIYIADTLKILTYDDADITKFLQVDQRNFFDEDGEPKKVIEVIEQMMQYLSLTIIPYQDSLYIIDYNGLKQNENSYWHYKNTYDAEYHYLTNNDFLLQPNKVTLSDHIGIKKDDIAMNGTKLSLLQTYNKMTVKDSLYSFDSIMIDLDDMSRWEDEIMEDIVGSHDDTNVVLSSGKKKYLGYGNFMIDEKNLDNITVIYNALDSDNPKKCFMRYFTMKQSEDANDKSMIKCYAYNKETCDRWQMNLPVGKWYWGSSVHPVGCYSFMRNHTCAQLVSYYVETMDKNDTIFVNPTKLDMKTAILISTPTEMSQRSKYVGDLPLMIEISSNIVTVGVGDYFHIDGKFKYYRGYDCLPISEPSYNSKANNATIPMTIRFGNKYFNKNEWVDEKYIWNVPFDYNDDTNAFGTDFKFRPNFDYRDLLGIESGLAIPSPATLQGDGIETNQLVIEIYRPLSPSNGFASPSKLTMITDFDIEVVTRSELNHINCSDDETDTEYTIIMDSDAIEDKGNITLDITTWDAKEPNFSFVAYSMNKNDMSQMRRLDHIFNKATFEICRAEEHILMNQMNQYSTPTVSLSMNLHLMPKPYSLFTYHYFNDKSFIFDSGDFDYCNNCNSINLIQKK